MNTNMEMSVIGSSFQSSSTTPINPLLFQMVPAFVDENDPMYYQRLFVFAGNRTKSNILSTVNDLDRSVIEHWTDELDNRVR